VIVRGEPAYPAILAADPEAPAVLFVRGTLDVLAARRVAVIGTRAATASGRRLARDLGHDLARHGVCVVSGLARGIDVAAHRGALSVTDVGTGPVAVVAGGLDRPYPREHAGEWNDVARHGALVGESPPGTTSDAFRFPLRNRIIAALSEVLVVVESRARGGSMLTVEHAMRRGIQVMAVPGSPSNVTSEGTNALLVDGCAPVRDASDVLDALGLDHSRSTPREQRATPTAADRGVLDALAAAPLSLDEIVAHVSRPVHDVAVSLGRLAAHGWVVEHAGWWEFVRTSCANERGAHQ
jgi:DNA processing protein